MELIIQHGKWGLDGLLNFVKYFVEGWSGKLGSPMERLEKKSTVRSA